MAFLDRKYWEREWLDLWTIVHFTTGMCFGFAIFFYLSPFKESFILFVLLTTLWEVIEHLNHAGEPLSNQFTDVLSGALGFLTTIYTVPIWTPTLLGQVAYFTLIFTIAWFFAYFGFQSFAIHLDRELDKYKKSFSAATLLYVIIISLVIFLNS